MSYDRLHSKVSQKSAKICIIGLGQVGLPTALTFCKEGYDVIGLDINKDLVLKLNQKKSLLTELGIDELLASCMEKGTFKATTNSTDAITTADVIIVCVATPINDEIKPDLSVLENVCSSLSKFSLENKLIIIESSIPPGTFEGLIIPLLGNKSEYGINYWTAFIPERFSPGQGLAEIQSTPRLIGCTDEKSGILAKTLYEKIVRSEILLVPIQVAEISKLVENTYRDVNIALANEISLICEKYGIDVEELIKVCNSHPRVDLLKPGPGVGGPCLPKDPYLLLNPQGMPPISSKLILESRKINDQMPSHVVNLIVESLASQNKDPKNSSILILGITYKANVNDTRFSPAKQIVTKLIDLGSKVYVYDPLTSETFRGEPVNDIWSIMSLVDVLVVITDHNEFKKLDLSRIKQTMKQIPIIVDTRRIFTRKNVEEIGINYIAVGYTKRIQKIKKIEI